MQPEAFHYHLPEERIAKFPLEDRSASKFLVYHQGRISHHVFKNLPQLAGKEYQMVFNNTRVIPARLIFYRESGARVEIFLLEPIAPSSLVQLAMLAQGQAVWKTMIGNLKKWKEEEVLQLDFPDGTCLKARLQNREEKIVAFEWEEDIQWHVVLEKAGKIPLPPYLNRDAEETDKETYQTVYAREEGAVAAPTAGLHFTPDILQALRDIGTGLEYVTLHVSAGTFQPLQGGDIREHQMHQEQMVISRTTLLKLIEDDRHRIAVGTTSLRTLESLYWYGVLLYENPEAIFRIPQDTPYRSFDFSLPGRQEALTKVLEKMDKQSVDALHGETEIYILPGYKPRNADSLITNFHQPGSTLLVLVEALIGKDWKQVYSEALHNDYRFLSYGDSSWLIW
jgi:S-adenosylmethionine:tRNA ribosyltransferase-isomerase